MSDNIRGVLGHLEAFHTASTQRLVEHLCTTLKVLVKRRHDATAIMVTLDEGIEVWQRERVRMNGQALARDEIKSLKRVIKGARLALVNLEELYLGWNEDSPHLVALRKMIDESDYRLSDLSHETLRRGRRGQPQEHITFIHERLKALGVLKVDRVALLQALGFVPTADTTRPTTRTGRYATGNKNRASKRRHATETAIKSAPAKT